MALPGEWNPISGTYVGGMGWTGYPNYGEARRRKDMEFLDRYGYLPGQQKEVQAAGQAAEDEWGQLVSELQGAIGRMQTDPLAQKIRDYFSGVMGGEDQPFDERTLAALVSGAVAPIEAGATADIGRARESFAARGLGRSGGLGSLEQAIRAQALQRAVGSETDIRSGGRLENWRARSEGAAGAAGFFGAQTGAQNQLVSQLASLRATRQYDPSYFRVNRLQPGRYETAGSRTVPYAVPPPLDRRRVGMSAPQYAA